MALQTKTFTWGSYKYKSESNAYVLELVLTENAISEEKNTSEIEYKLTLKSGSSNRFRDEVRSSLKLTGADGDHTFSGKDSRLLDYNSSWVLLSGTATVEHDAEGSLTMPIEVKLDSDAHSNQYAPPDKTLNWSWTLTTIPRASAISDAAAVTLGNACDVRWTPNSSAFLFKLNFYLGDDLIYTTEAIHPNKTSAYTYTGYTVPLAVAERITESDHADMTVELITYTDSDCQNEIGRDSRVFTVTVPSNADTQPTVNMELTAVNGLDGLYIQGQSKVQAKISAEGKLGAGIQDENCSITVEGIRFTDPYISDTLTTAGEVEITGSAVDTRGITGAAKQNITVQPYYIPRLTGVAAYRCDSTGKAADDGEYLKIEATRDYAPVTVEGVQHNFCRILYRYKAEDAEKYPDPDTILEADAQGDSVVTKPLLNATFSKEKAYMVQILVVDTVGRDQTVTVAIPSERVFQHKRAGGKGMGLGGMCEEDDLLDVHWNQRVRKDLQVDGNICGAYIRVAGSSGGPELTTVKVRSLTEQAGETSTQSIFALGKGFGSVWTLIRTGNVWHAADSSGNTVSGEAEEDEAEEGIVTIQLPTTRETPILMISADPFEIIK